MGRINLYDNYSQIVDEVLSETGQYDLTGLNLNPEGTRPVYKAICDHYLRKFKHAMSLHRWKFASEKSFLHYDKSHDQDGFLSVFSVRISAGDYYNIWDISLADGKENKETFVARVSSDNKVFTNYKVSDGEDPDKIVYAQIVGDVEIAKCPAYFTDLYKNILKQFVGWLLHDMNGIASMALKEYPVVLQQAIAQDERYFASNPTFKIKTQPVPTW